MVGEVLIDLLPDGDKQKAVVGGGPANTAVALSKLGIKAQFINGISTDPYGSDCRQYLENAGVFTAKSYPVILPRHLVQDIDTPEDWERAERMFQSI